MPDPEMLSGAIVCVYQLVDKNTSQMYHLKIFHVREMYGGRPVQTSYNVPKHLHKKKSAAVSKTLQIKKHKCTKT